MAFKDLRAKKLFPVHWGMFVLSIHSWFEPMERLSIMSEEQSFEILSPKLGQIVDLNTPTVFNKWWHQDM